MSMATTLPSDVMRSQMRRKAHRLSGHGASISTVVSESALVSANLTRTPSKTRKYVDICDAVPVLIRGSSFIPLQTGLSGRLSEWLLAKRSDDDISGFGAAVILLPGDEVAVTDGEALPEASLDVVGLELVHFV